VKIRLVRTSAAFLLVVAMLACTPKQGGPNPPSTSGGAGPRGSETVVPVNLARYGNENLISRSQAKRLLARLELFKTVLFDFSNVPTIGQAFADEIFRVFAASHPEIELVPIHTNSQ
jgi:hypothetical protein